MIKKSLILILLFTIFVITSAVDLKGGKFTYALDTLVAGDSVKIPYKIWGEYLEGYGSLIVHNRLVKTDANLKIYIEYSHDSTIWVGRTLIDSLDTKDTTTYDLSGYLKPYLYFQIVLDAFNGAGESLAVTYTGFLIPRRSITR